MTLSLFPSSSDSSQQPRNTRFNDNSSNILKMKEAWN